MSEPILKQGFKRPYWNFPMPKTLSPWDKWLLARIKERTFSLYDNIQDLKTHIQNKYYCGLKLEYIERPNNGSSSV